MRSGVRFALFGALAMAGVGSAHADPEAWRAQGRAQIAEAKALARSLPTAPARARNVILFIGDGMGVPTITAARILEGQQRGEPGEENLLSFEKLPYVALIKTYNTNQQVPDSAGTMTAMVAGVKTRAGVLGVDDSVRRSDHGQVAAHRVASICEQAEQRGLSTGIVTTARLTHATPAGCYAHAPERDWEDDSKLTPSARQDDFPDIARQLIEFPHGDGIDVALGGGRSNFQPRTARDPEYPDAKTGRRLDGRDLVAEWVARRPHSRYVWNRAGFDAVDAATTDHLLGLFEPSHMQFEVDREGDAAGEPSLSEMTATAIAILSRNPKGYFLTVEAGRIDHAHHLNNAYRGLTDTVALSDAVRTALELTDPKETLVIVTADHGHVLSLGGYPLRGNPILGKVRINDARGEKSDELATDAVGRPYTTLGYSNGPGYTGASASQPEGPKKFPHTAPEQKYATRGRPDLSEVDTGNADYLQESAVPLAAETHSGEDVPAYAGGAGSQLVHGVQEQSFVYHVMAEAFGWTGEEPADGGAGGRPALSAAATRGSAPPSSPSESGRSAGADWW